MVELNPGRLYFRATHRNSEIGRGLVIQALGELEKKWCPKLKSRDSNEAGTVVVRALIQLPMSEDRRLQIKFRIAQGGGHIYRRARK